MHLSMKPTLLAWLLVVAGLDIGALEKEAGALRPVQIDDGFALKIVGGPQVSPGGEWVACTVRPQNLEKDSRESRLWTAPTISKIKLAVLSTGSTSA
jgi:hypothetical protein